MGLNRAILYFNVIHGAAVSNGTRPVADRVINQAQKRIALRPLASSGRITYRRSVILKTHQAGQLPPIRQPPVIGSAIINNVVQPCGTIDDIEGIAP